MDIKRLVIGIVTGAIVLHIVGYIMFDIALIDFYVANAGPAENAFRESTMQWPLAVGNIAFAALLTLAITSRPGSASVGGATVTGAVIGFLVWAGSDFVYYGFTNMWTLTIVIIDPFLEAIHNAIAGAAIALVLSKVAPATG